MKLTQKLPAVILAALLAATWVVPAMISKNVPEQVSIVAEDQTVTLSAVTGAEITFEAPAGWTTTPLSDPTSVVYTKEQDRQELSIAVTGGSHNFDNTADRVLRESSISGTSAAFDGEQVSAGGGFSGKSCVAIKPSAKATGPCAVVHKGTTVVTVIATSTSTGSVLDLQGLLDSLQLTKEDES